MGGRGESERRPVNSALCLVGSAPDQPPMERSGMGGRTGERYEVRKHPKAVANGAKSELHGNRAANGRQLSAALCVIRL